VQPRDEPWKASNSPGLLIGFDRRSPSAVTFQPDLVAPPHWLMPRVIDGSDETAILCRLQAL